MTANGFAYFEIAGGSGFRLNEIVEEKPCLIVRISYHSSDYNKPFPVS
jgi:hypothetical protein